MDISVLGGSIIFVVLLECSIYAAILVCFRCDFIVVVVLLERRRQHMDVSRGVCF